MKKSIRSYLRKKRERRFRKLYKVGDFSYGTPQVFHWGEPSELTIGKFCSIAQNVKIFLGGEHRIDWVSTFPFREFFQEAENFSGHPRTKGDVVIGNDVWVGYGAIILSGVSVGDGAVIGAGAIVTRDIPPYAVAIGNPARIVNFRFEQGVIDKLVEIRWWDWPLEKIVQNIELLMSNNVGDLIDQQTRSSKSGTAINEDNGI